MKTRLVRKFALLALVAGLVTGPSLAAPALDGADAFIITRQSDEALQKAVEVIQAQRQSTTRVIVPAKGRRQHTDLDKTLILGGSAALPM